LCHPPPPPPPPPPLPPVSKLDRRRRKNEKEKQLAGEGGGRRGGRGGKSDDRKIACFSINHTILSALTLTMYDERALLFSSGREELLPLERTLSQLNPASQLMLFPCTSPLPSFFYFSETVCNHAGIQSARRSWLKKVKGYLLLCDSPFIYVVNAISPWFWERLTCCC
jgi:hypothetical protein